MTEKSDHDLLIEINTKVTLFVDSFLKHVAEDAGKFETLTRSVTAVHRRIDQMLVVGLLSVLGLIVTIGALAFKAFNHS